MHARFVARRLRKKFERVCECQVRILAAQQGRGNGREFLGHNHRGSPCGARGAGILGIGHESELSGARVFDAGNAGNFGVRRTIFQPGVESRSNLCKFHKLCPELVGRPVIVTEAEGISCVWGRVSDPSSRARLGLVSLKSLLS